MNLILIHRHEIESIAVEDDQENNRVIERKESVTISYSDERYQHALKHLQKKDGDIIRIGIVNESTGTATVHFRPSDNETVIVNKSLNEDTNNHPPKKKRKKQKNCIATAGGGIGESMVLSDWKVVPLSVDKLPKVELILGMMQPKTLKRLWPVLSSLGICHITIAGGDLCEDAYKHTSIITPAVYQPLIDQGLAQSTVPLQPTIDIQTTKSLSEIISVKRQQQQTQKQQNFVWIGLDVGTYPSIRTIVQQSQKDGNNSSVPRVILLVGPERGYTEQEIIMMKKNGIQLASMGPWIQRTDVACITSISLAIDALREL